MRLVHGITLSLLLAAGCGERAAPANKPSGKKTAPGLQPVTLHVEGMTQRLGLF